MLKNNSTMDNKHPDTHEQEIVENAAEQAGNQTEDPKTTQDAENDPPENDSIQQQLEESRKKYLYLLSDFENFKRNVAKERLELKQTAGRDIVTALLPVLDDFDRAAKNKPLDEGIALIHHKLRHTLQSFGLSELNFDAGDAFDADTQEAVAEIPAPSKKVQGKIVEVIEKGYKLGERIIRYAKVVIGK